MKITKKYLQKMIKEELQQVIAESGGLLNEQLSDAQIDQAEDQADMEMMIARKQAQKTLRDAMVLLKKLNSLLNKV